MSVGQMFQNLFSGNSAAAPAAQPVQPQPGNLPEQMTAGMAADPANPNVPANSNPAPAEGLDKFNDLWKPAESPAGQQADPMFNVDPKQLMDAARKIDFAKVIQPAQLQAISQGGDAAVQAFAAAMNQVAQTVYAQSAHATSKIVEQAINKSQDNMRSELPQHIKRQTVSESLRAENPALTHPAASPILGALEQQMTQKFPNASSSEISKMAQEYLVSFSKAMQKPEATPTTSSGSKDADWSAYLN
jgi:hypothetical protein